MKHTILTLSMVFIFLGCNESQSSINSKDIVIIDNIMYQNQSFNSKVELTEQEKFAPNFLDNIMKKSRQMNWSLAKDYCENLEVRSYSNWKLPTHKELEKISSVEIYYGLGDYNYWKW